MDVVQKMAARTHRWTQNREQGSICSSLRCSIRLPPSSMVLIPESFGSVCHLLKISKSGCCSLLSLSSPITTPQATWLSELFSKMFIMSYDCLFHLLLTHGGLASSQGLEVRHMARGKVKNAAFLFLSCGHLLFFHPSFHRGMNAIFPSNEVKT